MIFDLKHSFPLAVRILKEELGLLSALHCLLCFGWRKIWQRPFKPLASQLSNAKEEVLTRHQLEPVLLLEAALSVDLKINKDRTLGILRRVVRESGAQFIQFAVQSPSPQEWRAKSIDAKNEFAQKGLLQFFNAEAQVVSAPAAHFAFDVKLCHFVRLTQALGRPDLAPLFCGADEALFNQPELRVSMTRAETLATGHERCAFRFRWDENPQED